MWGRSPKWAKADRAYHRLSGVSYEACISAVQDMFLAGSAHAPSIPELIARARLNQGVQEIDYSRCDHPDWAILPADGYDLGVCRVCHMEQKFPTGSLKTPMERGIEDVEVPI